MLFVNVCVDAEELAWSIGCGKRLCEGIKASQWPDKSFNSIRELASNRIRPNSCASILDRGVIQYLSIGRPYAILPRILNSDTQNTPSSLKYLTRAFLRLRSCPAIALQHPISPYPKNDTQRSTYRRHLWSTTTPSPRHQTKLNDSSSSSPAANTGQGQ